MASRSETEGNCDRKTGRVTAVSLIRRLSGHGEEGLRDISGQEGRI